MVRLSPKIMIAVALTQIAATLSASAVYLLWHNSLATNGNWHSAKLDLEVPVMAAETYCTTSQALARCHLNLAAWHGFQEVLHHRPVDLRNLQCRFLLSKDMYIHFIYHRDEGAFWGIRLSSNAMFPSISYKASYQGEFLYRVPIAHPLLRPEHWYRLGLRVEDGQPTLTLDGQPVDLDGIDWKPFTTLGFWGADLLVLVDDIVAEETDGTVIHDTFVPTRDAAIVVPLAFALVFLFSLVMGMLTRWNGFNPIQMAIGLVFINVLIAAAMACAFVIVFLSQHKYPREGWLPERVANQVRGECLGELREQVNEYTAERPEGLYRIAFLGTSQTQGAGAAKSEERWVSRIQQLLDADSSSDLRHQCIRAGIGGGDSTLLLDVYRDLLLPLRPNVLVINLGTNDQDPATLATNLHRLIDISEENGVRTMILLEPNSVECVPGDLRTHPAMREVAEERGVPCIELHEYMKKHYDDGILWWDFVHPTSFGHRLIAERVVKALQEHHLLTPASH